MYRRRCRRGLLVLGVVCRVNEGVSSMSCWRRNENRQPRRVDLLKCSYRVKCLSQSCQCVKWRVQCQSLRWVTQASRCNTDIATFITLTAFIAFFFSEKPLEDLTYSRSVYRSCQCNYWCVNVVISFWRLVHYYGTPNTCSDFVDEMT